MAEHPAVEFLMAALGRAEETAKAATPGPWEPEKPLLTDTVTSALLGRVADCSVGTGYRSQAVQDARHIALHDPAAVLRRVAGERQILAEHQPRRAAKWRGPNSWDPCELPGCPCVGVAEESPEADLIDGCGTCASGHLYDAVVEHYPCRTVLLLAQAWGWEEEA